MLASLEEFGMADVKCYELTANPIPHPPALLDGKQKNLKWSWAWEEERGGRKSYKICSNFLLSYFVIQWQ